MTEPSGPNDGPTRTVVRDDRTSRYVLAVDGTEVGKAEYAVDEGRILFLHTEVSADLGGGGHGSFLVREALADARERGLTVVPLCPFVAAYLGRHPDEADVSGS